MKAKLPPKPRKPEPRKSHTRTARIDPCTFRIENQYPEFHVAGIDEVGRGCLAGAAYVGGVVFDRSLRQGTIEKHSPLSQIKDSKVVKAEKRKELAEWIRANALATSVVRAELEDIERYNILQAVLRAAKKVAENLAEALRNHSEALGLVLMDGNQLIPQLGIRQVTVVDGDYFCKTIAAASILAKVARDEEMCRLAEQYPGYDFESNKGYGTPRHLDGLRRLGPCAIHRLSFLRKLSFLEFGKISEERVCRFLQSEGFEIADRNWRCADGELDLVAYKKEEIHFFEVRARRENFQVDLAFPSSKQMKFQRAVRAYLQERALRRASRLHLIAVENENIHPYWDVFKLA